MKSLKVEGLSWRVIVALLYSMVIFLPVQIFLAWVAPINIASAVSSIVIMLFTELAFRSGQPLTKQETFLLYSLSGIVVSEAVFTSIVYNCYLITSPISNRYPFVLDQLQKLWWFAPSVSSILRRNLFEVSFLPPVVVLAASFLLTGKMIDPALGVIMYNIFSLEEKLPFPLQQPDAQMIETLTERQPDKMKWFTVALVPSFVYGFILWTLPYGFNIPTIPLMPDLTYIVERILPGASLAIITSLTPYVTGTILNFKVAFSLFLGSILIYIIANSLVVNLFPGITDWRWHPGMSHFEIYQQSILYVWGVPLVGLGLSVAIGMIITNPKVLALIFRRSRQKSVEQSLMPISNRTALLLWLGASLAISVLDYALLSSVYELSPIFILVFFFASFGMSYVNSLISTASIGMSGYGISLTDPVTGVDITQALIYTTLLSERSDVWFLPSLVSSGGSWWAVQFKIAELTETKPRSYLLAHYVVFPIVWLLGLIYTSILWRLAPVPSNLYFWPSVVWPVSARFKFMWASGEMANIVLKRTSIVAYPFIIGLSLMILCKFVNIPFSLPVFLAGATQPTTTPIAIFVGYLVGRFIEKRYGNSWSSRKTVILAGVIAGESLAILLGIGAFLIRKAIWSLPF